MEQKNARKITACRIPPLDSKPSTPCHHTHENKSILSSKITDPRASESRYVCVFHPLQGVRVQSVCPPGSSEHCHGGCRACLGLAAVDSFGWPDPIDEASRARNCGCRDHRGKTSKQIMAAQREGARSKAPVSPWNGIDHDAVALRTRITLWLAVNAIPRMKMLMESRLILFALSLTPGCVPSTYKLGMVAYQVENNESQLMGIRKQEYLRVLSNIVKESQQAQVIVPRWGAIGCPAVPSPAFMRGRLGESISSGVVFYCRQCLKGLPIRLLSQRRLSSLMGKPV